MSVVGVSVGTNWGGTALAFCTTAVAAAASRSRQRRHRRELALLSDDQLRDAGIDLALAGRGKAAAVHGNLLRRVQCL